jgi:hypothetical protein
MKKKDTLRRAVWRVKILGGVVNLSGDLMHKVSKYDSCLNSRIFVANNATERERMCRPIIGVTMACGSHRLTSLEHSTSRIEVKEYDSNEKLIGNSATRQEIAHASPCRMFVKPEDFLIE